MLIALPLAFAAYSWYRHIFERECLALLREEEAMANREAREAYLARAALVRAADPMFR